ncbi:hypothetical protein H8B06_18550 [Sphingobacterium sp. DN00404]|uniref:ABC transporter permease n=1 Tax=Sphingobacterium micropteri TaxID=2763501 RepID=A0ABR7YU01_9SPHI|nr:hypothetical protein [Sphingobacterium micropteri]MBD1434831.1 hypothetical protein [Sphingobacterium micropteri]
MNNHLHKTRLSIALKELWLSNKTWLFSLPLVMLLLFVIFYLWPGSIFYNKLFHPEMSSSPDAWIEWVLGESVMQRTFILFTVAVYVIVCTSSFLHKLNKSERTNLTPISQLERTLTLTLFAIGVICLGTICFIAYDFAFVSWFRHLYLDQALYYLERQGNLYPDIWDKTIFHTIPVRRTVGMLFQTMLLSLPFYMLSLVFFKKYSFLWFCGLMVVIWVMLVFVLSMMPKVPYDSDTIRITLEHGIPKVTYILLVLGYWCLAMATFYYKLKEKEI